MSAAQMNLRNAAIVVCSLFDKLSPEQRAAMLDLLADIALNDGEECKSLDAFVFEWGEDRVGIAAECWSRYCRASAGIRERGK